MLSKKEEEQEKNRIFFKKRLVDEWMLKLLFVYLILMFFALALNWAFFLKMFYSFLVFIGVVAAVELREIRQEKKAKEEEVS